jgi:acetamidase/formamidase
MRERPAIFPQIRAAAKKNVSRPYPPQDAYALCSVVADLRATATVDAHKV